MIKKFKNKMSREGRSYRWFHKTYLKNVTYSYFIIQLNEPDRMHDSIKKAISKYLEAK